jgi:hypothetical protein
LSWSDVFELGPVCLPLSQAWIRASVTSTNAIAAHERHGLRVVLISSMMASRRSSDSR